MDIVTDFKYPIEYITRFTTYPVYHMNRVPFLNKEDANAFIELELKNECYYRQGTYIAIPYEGTALVPREKDLVNLQRAWDNANHAIHDVVSKTIRCKHCDSAFQREKVESSCLVCFKVLGSNTNINRINRCTEKLIDYCRKQHGVNHLIVKL